MVIISLLRIAVDAESNGCQHRQARAVEVRVCRAPISGSRKKQESTAECINESSDENIDESSDENTDENTDENRNELINTATSNEFRN